MGSSPTARTTSEQTALHCVNRHSRKAVPVDIRSAPFAPPFKSEPAALGFGFVFLCWRLGGGKFRRLFLRSKKGRHPLRYIRSSFQNRSRRLRVCVLGGVCFASFAPPFKPEAIGFGFVFWEASVSLRLCLLLTRSRRVRVWGGRFRLCGGYILRLRGGRLCRIWRP